MDEELTQLWMVPYADLMSTMVLLFMSLFAYSYAQRQPEYERTLAGIEKDVATRKEAPRAEARLLEADLAVRLKAQMLKLGLRDFGVTVTARHVRLTLPAPVIFAEGSPVLEPGAESILDAVAGLFAGVPNPILVEGHTDDVPVTGGRYRSNWELSAARAFSVIEALGRRGLPPDRFHARGYGEYRPVAPNGTAEGRARNRRIEISLIRELRNDEG